MVTLVHGTLARHNKFPELESALRTVPGTDVTRVGWSGWNTATARRLGTDRLRAHIRDVAARHPTARQFVIGHSCRGAHPGQRRPFAGGCFVALLPLFGPEYAMRAAYLKVSVESTPPGIWTVHHFIAADDTASRTAQRIAIHRQYAPLSNSSGDMLARGSISSRLRPAWSDAPSVSIESLNLSAKAAWARSFSPKTRGFSAVSP